MIYPGLIENYRGYVLRAHPGISDDGRFGRCWYHVYRSDSDERADRRVFALVMLVHHMYIDRGDRPLDAVALHEARRAVHALIDDRKFRAGRLYRKTIGAEGIVRDTVEELRDNIYA